MFKALKHTTDEVELRALREQLSAAVAGLVEMIGLYPRGPTPDGEKGDRFLKVLLKNGKSFEVEAPGLNA